MMLVVTCLVTAGDFLHDVSCSVRDVSIQAAVPGVVVLLMETMQGWDTRKSRYVLVSVPPSLGTSVCPSVVREVLCMGH